MDRKATISAALSAFVKQLRARDVDSVDVVGIATDYCVRATAADAAAAGFDARVLLGLTAGVLEILLGFWVSQQEFPAQALLLILWVGFFALFRGFSDILLAFEVRGLQHK